jgi:hypothetical protein
VAEGRLLRESPREEYFYQLGRLEAFREAGVTTLVGVLESVVRNAKAQVPDEPEAYYGN